MRATPAGTAATPAHASLLAPTPREGAPTRPSRPAPAPQLSRTPASLRRPESRKPSQAAPGAPAPPSARAASTPGALPSCRAGADLSRALSAAAAGAVVLPWYSRRVAMSDLPSSYAGDCHVRSGRELSHCMRGDPAGSVFVALFGDSHAAAWEPALHALGVARGWRVEMVTHSACPPFARGSDSCGAWRGAALRHLAAARPALVVLSSLYSYGLVGNGSEALDASLGSLAGLRLLWLGDSPPVEADAPACLHAFATSDARRCDLRRSTPLFERFGEAVRAAVTRHGGAFIDVRRWMCDSTVCPAALGGVSVVRDESGHLAASFTRRLAQCLLKSMLEVGLAPPDAVDGVGDDALWPS